MIQWLLHRSKTSLCWLIIALSIVSCGIPESGVPPAQVEPAPSASPLVEPSAEPSAAPTTDVKTTPIPPTPTQALQAVVDARFYWDWAQAEEWHRRHSVPIWKRGCGAVTKKVIGADQDAIARATAAARPPAPKIDSPPPRQSDYIRECANCPTGCRRWQYAGV